MAGEAEHSKSAAGDKSQWCGLEDQTEGIWEALGVDNSTARRLSKHTPLSPVSVYFTHGWGNLLAKWSLDPTLKEWATCYIYRSHTHIESFQVEKGWELLEVSRTLLRESDDGWLNRHDLLSALGSPRCSRRVKYVREPFSRVDRRGERETLCWLTAKAWQLWHRERLSHLCLSTQINAYSRIASSWMG